LIKLAQSGSANYRKPALQALGLLAGEAELPLLIDLVAETKDDQLRAEAAAALNGAYQRCQTRTGHAPVQLLVVKLNSGDPNTRVALLPVCSGLSSPEIRTALQKALADQNAAVREAAIRAVCDTTDPELLPQVVQIARETQDENFKTIAISACVRLTSPEENPRLTNAQRLEPLKQILQP